MSRELEVECCNLVTSFLDGRMPEGLKWDDRRATISEMLCHDVCILTEANKRMVKELAVEMGDMEFMGAASIIGKRWEDITEEDYVGELVVVAYSRERFRCAGVETRWLSETPQVVGSKSWDNGRYPRVVVRVRLEDRWSSRMVSVFGTHYDDQGREARRQSVGVELEFVKETLEMWPHELVVCGGDRNWYPDAGGVEDMERYMSLAESMGVKYVKSVGAPHKGLETTWIGYESDPFRAPRDEDGFPVARVYDALFTNVGKVVKTSSVPMVMDDGRLASDHTLVGALLEV